MFFAIFDVLSLRHEDRWLLEEAHLFEDLVEELFVADAGLCRGVLVGSTIESQPQTRDC